MEFVIFIAVCKFIVIMMTMCAYTHTRYSMRRVTRGARLQPNSSNEDSQQVEDNNITCNDNG